MLDAPPWPEVIPGHAPILLVAPHGALRDHVRVPWGSRPLRMNDVHTAALTCDLAARTGAAAVVNHDVDRNLIDLNRLSDALAGAPAFLDAVDRTLHGLLARHPRVTVLFVHGWNVGAPAVDLGFGVRPGHDEDPTAISPAFRDRTLAALTATCAAAGIRATLGARYPARARENLLQLFTGRYRDDARPLIRHLASAADRVDALQVELGLPLRFPGPWRERFLNACAAALAQPAAVAAEPIVTNRSDDRVLPQCTVQLAGAVSGLVRIGRDGGLLVCVFATGEMVSFTGERVHADDAPGRIGGLSSHATATGVEIRYRGPCLRFADTRPFEDLERGFATARSAELDVTIAVDTGADGFGHAAGVVDLDGVRHALVASAFRGNDAVAPGAVRAALRLDAHTTLSLEGFAGATHGLLRHRDEGHAVTRVAFDPPDLDTGDDRLSLHLTLADGSVREIAVETVHRVPVVRSAPRPGARSVLAACRVAGSADPSGWIELHSPPPPENSHPSR